MTYWTTEGTATLYFVAVVLHSSLHSRPEGGCCDMCRLDVCGPCIVGGAAGTPSEIALTVRGLSCISL